MTAPTAEVAGYFTADELAAQAPLPNGWRGLLIPTNTRSGDRREYILDTAVTEVPARPLPLPLNAQKYSGEGHDGSEVVGLITRLWLDQGAVWGEGTFDLADPCAADWAAKLGRGVAGWVSVDLSDIAVEEVPLDADGNEVPDEAFAGVDTPDDPANPVASWLMRVTEWRMMGVTLVASPAFEQARIEPVYDMAPAPPIAPPKVHTGGMVTLVPAAEDAHRLAIAGYEAVDELHVTLAYLGDAVDWSPEQRDDLTRAVTELADRPLIGEVWGHAAFNPAGDEPCAVYLVKGDDLPDLHAAVWDVLENNDTPTVPTNHSPWTPHMTAGYGLSVAELAEVGPIRFDRLRIAFGGQNRDIYLDTITSALTASAVVYEYADFDIPEASELTALTVTPSGRVFGHLADRLSCHIGFADVCVTPPVSNCDYAYFHQGEVTTTEGPLPVGKITLGTGHANMHASAKGAAEHYDNTATAVAIVRCRDGALGPWLSGRILPGVTDEKVAELRRSGVSGDWRGVRRGSNDLELVACLAVNVPGFPVPRTRALAASGVRTLVAAAVRPRRALSAVSQQRLTAAAQRVRAAKLDLLTRRYVRN